MKRQAQRKTLLKCSVALLLQSPLHLTAHLTLASPANSLMPPLVPFQEQAFEAVRQVGLLALLGWARIRILSAQAVAPPRAPSQG